ncbi:hypothetical protein EX895_006361 [Sporisorium graminicola]|uniref:Uncharacterized protein n=1 Tax=Sporisorium graminicola TaxID=280036 RepID=A0A4U7KM10_9BASI|nr:hypothetical protein EX895_006361 [Sporisorium graminicola]TKY85281.1 hypothetical protein EX895_006361 [Sporisorium graminicola]
MLRPGPAPWTSSAMASTSPGSTRDAARETLKRQLPYFKRTQDDEASIRRGRPFQVYLCRNGMSAFDAKWSWPSNPGSSAVTGAEDEGGPLSLPLKFRSS